MTNFKIFSVELKGDMFPIDQTVELLLSRYQDSDGDYGVDFRFFYHKVDNFNDTSEEGYEEFHNGCFTLPGSFLAETFVENFTHENAYRYVVDNIFIPENKTDKQ